jgi:hypothetical protein
MKKEAKKDAKKVAKQEKKPDEKPKVNYEELILKNLQNPRMTLDCSGY